MMKIENEYFDKVEDNLFNLLMLVTKDLNLQQLQHLNSTDLLNLIEKYLSQNSYSQ